MKATDKTAYKLGLAMRNARRNNFIPHSIVAKMLKITNEELTRFEYGCAEIPQPILDRIFILGYIMIHARRLNAHYREITRIFLKFGAPGMMSDSRKK